MLTPRTLRWDIFCRVIDNFGDLGVCWRLARQLACAGDRVRLVVDDAAALAWMAPGGAEGVQVLAWPGPDQPGDVAIEAFGCDPPAPYVMAMLQRRPVWINLEHLSAEDYVERSHGLPSPQRNGLTKWFFFPGFTVRTGGLLREATLMPRRRGFRRRPWLARHAAARPGERVVSLFCYDNAALPALLDSLVREPTLLLLTAGHAQRLVPQVAAPLRTHSLPYLRQDAFDRLLWSCDLNIVRGEDSLVRAMWAGVPFLWQAYPQRDGAQGPKVEALASRMGLAPEVAQAWRGWNGLAAWPGLPPLAPWRAATLAWRQTLLAQPDLALQLRAFVDQRRAQAPGL